jgi:hypothetical protein
MGWTATGTWQGYYKYDPMPDAPDLPTQVKFGMRLAQSWLFGALSGEVWDEPPGPPDRGTIEGRVTGDGVIFLKRMPVYRMWWNGRLVTLAEYLLQEFNRQVDKPIPHPPIRYTGKYRAAEEVLEGTWEFVPGTTRFTSEGRAWAFDNPPASGSWAARRAAAF